MKVKHESETWKWNIKVKNESETWKWNIRADQMIKDKTKNDAFFGDTILIIWQTLPVIPRGFM